LGSKLYEHEHADMIASRGRKLNPLEAASREVEHRALLLIDGR
jgi:hypothetical protein